VGVIVTKEGVVVLEVLGASLVSATLDCSGAFGWFVDISLGSKGTGVWRCLCVNSNNMQIKKTTTDAIQNSFLMVQVGFRLRLVCNMVKWSGLAIPTVRYGHREMHY